MPNIIERSNPLTKQWLVGTLTLIALVFFVYYTDWVPWLRFPFAYLILLTLYYLFHLTMRLYAIGTGRISTAAFLTGVFFIIGGAAFDMIVTVIKSPSLDREANPVARALLDSGQTLPFVYGYGVTAQFLLVSVTCLMWAAFLRHRAEMVASAKSTAHSWFDFIKAMTGGGHLSWRQYFLPLKFSELPNAYHVFWVFVVMWVAFTPTRFYYGLEWLGIFPGLRLQVLATWSILMGAGYFLWLWLEYRKASK